MTRESHTKGCVITNELALEPSISLQLSQFFLVPMAPRPFPTVEPILVYTWYPSLSGWKRGLPWVVGPSTNLVRLVRGLEIAPPTRGVGNPIRVLSCHWLEWGQAILLSSLQLSFFLFFYTSLMEFIAFLKLIGKWWGL